jgi:hypothetical protein
MIEELVVSDNNKDEDDADIEMAPSIISSFSSASGMTVNVNSNTPSKHRLVSKHMISQIRHHIMEAAVVDEQQQQHGINTGDNVGTIISQKKQLLNNKQHSKIRSKRQQQQLQLQLSTTQSGSLQSLQRTGLESGASASASASTSIATSILSNYPSPSTPTMHNIHNISAMPSAKAYAKGGTNTPSRPRP